MRHPCPLLNPLMPMANRCQGCYHRHASGREKKGLRLRYLSPSHFQGPLSGSMELHWDPLQHTDQWAGRKSRRGTQRPKFNGNNGESERPIDNRCEPMSTEGPEDPGVTFPPRVCKSSYCQMLISKKSRQREQLAGQQSNFITERLHHPLWD